MLYYNKLPGKQNPDGGGYYQNIMQNDGKVGIGYYEDNVAEDFGVNNLPTVIKAIMVLSN